MATTGGAASAATPLGGNTGGYQLSASSTGLYVNLFGQEITGGTSSAGVTYANNPGSPNAKGGPFTETATAQGQGVFLTTQGVNGQAKASVDDNSASPTASDVQGAAASALPLPLPSSGGGITGCAQGGGGGSSGVGLFIGIGCAVANVAIDPATATTADGPTATGAGEVAEVQVDVSGILNQVYSGGAKQLCDGLSGIPTLGPVLGGACTQILTSVTPTIDVCLGAATSQITNGATPTATAKSSSIDVRLFPGKATGGCLNTTDPGDLLDVQIPSATAVTTIGTDGTASGTYDSTLIKISGTLITALGTLGFPNPIEIPPNNSGTSQASQLCSATQGLICLDLASATSDGKGNISADGLKVGLLHLSQVPGNGITIDTSGVSSSGGPSTAGATQTSQPPTAPAQGQPPVQTAAAASPTAVHTGEWWSGSLPLIAFLGATGGLMIGWPRLRRMGLLHRLVSRSGR
ncbi:MAG TPA: hypothetical protein VE991_14620 [Acidimicrobiales bacterium]|nr:hypothetical protein [Acidimicrobiales bacterium]